MVQTLDQALKKANSDNSSAGNISNSSTSATLATSTHNLPRAQSKTFAQEINRKYVPEIQPLCASEPIRCYLSSAPSLGGLAKSVSPKFATSWLTLQIAFYSQTLKSADQLTEADVQNLALVIIANYPRLTLSEIMLFFSRLSGGVYGKVGYGQVKPEDITSKIPEFLKQRDRELAFYELDKRRREAEAEAANRAARAVSHSEYRRIVSDLARVRFGGDLDKATAFIAANPDFDFRVWRAQNVQALQ